MGADLALNPLYRIPAGCARRKPVGRSQSEKNILNFLATPKLQTNLLSIRVLPHCAEIAVIEKRNIRPPRLRPRVKEQPKIILRLGRNFHTFVICDEFQFIYSITCLFSWPSFLCTA